MSDKITHVKIGNLLAHPLNKKLYGDRVVDKSFYVSVRELGVLEPITIATLSLDGSGLKTYVLSGHRRFLAAKQLGHKTIPARIADVDTTNPAKVEQYLIEANRQRAKTWEQRGREFKELWRIETEFAKQRQRLSLGQGVSGGKGMEPVPDLKRGTARDIAAEKSSLNLTGRAAADFVKIIDAADAGSVAARSALDAINTEEKKITPAFKELFGTKKSRKS